MKELNLKNKINSKTRILWVLVYVIVFTLTAQLFTDEGLLVSIVGAIFMVTFYMFVLSPILNGINSRQNKKD